MGLSVPSLSTCCLWAGLWNAPFEQVGARRVPAPSCGLCRQREGKGRDTSCRSCTYGAETPLSAVLQHCKGNQVIGEHSWEAPYGTVRLGLISCFLLFFFFKEEFPLNCKELSNRAHFLAGLHYSTEGFLFPWRLIFFLFCGLSIVC